MDKIYIIDASGYIYRSYYAIRQMTNAKGESTNALFGFIRSILKLIKDFSPTHLVAVFDGPQNASKRTEIYANYKAHRVGMPPDLLHQIEWARDFCQLMGIPELTVPGVEADDTIGSVAQWAAKQGATVYMCTSDKDMCQLVNDHIFVLNTQKENQILDKEGVKQQFGVPPEKIVDFLAITGDSSDNVPGLSGFGPKTAAELLNTFGSLDYILAHPNEVSGKKKQETLIAEKSKVLLGRQLVTLDTTVDFPKENDFFRWRKAEKTALRDFYKAMNFNSLIREMGEDVLDSSQPSFHPVEENVDYILVDDEATLKQLIHELQKQPEICIDTETTDIRPMQAELVGIGLGFRPQEAWYIPTNGKLGIDKVLHYIKPFLENPKIGFYGHHLKYDYHVLANYNIKIASISFDTLIASYLLNAHSRQHSLDYLALELFNKVKIPIQDLIGKGKNQISMAEVPIVKVCTYCCEDVDYTVRLKEVLAVQLKERGLEQLFEEIELPLLPILAKMERHGIYVDVNYLHHLSKELGREIRQLEEIIYDLAGESFNLNSPKQLSQILFNKLGIKPPRKTTTGLSTSAEVLDFLQNDYPIASRILEYRSLEKLRSTYADSLPQSIHPSTHRIHCTFNQSATATGRLSCQDPNLQNIPIRTTIGRKIREAFRPQKEGWSYLSADYSQIELRLLAHLSEDPTLMEAFLANEDVHAYTASLIFNIPIEEVTPEQRYQAKAVNFGTVYGQQAFGLSQLLGIDQKTAAAFIQMYFKRYPKVKSYLEDSKEVARRTGKAVSLFGRERLIPEIHNKNASIRIGAERLAINTPLQGTQADIIKTAMVQIDRRLTSEKRKSYLILQIHDELIFEVPDPELKAMEVLVRESMTHVIQLNVPLIVDIHIGKNWKEC